MSCSHKCSIVMGKAKMKCFVFVFHLNCHLRTVLNYCYETNFHVVSILFLNPCPHLQCRKTQDTSQGLVCYCPHSLQSRQDRNSSSDTALCASEKDSFMFFKIVYQRTHLISFQAAASRQVLINANPHFFQSSPSSTSAVLMSVSSLYSVQPSQGKVLMSFLTYQMKTFFYAYKYLRHACPTHWAVKGDLSCESR